MQLKLTQASFLLSLVGVTLLFGWIVQPFAGAVLWAVVVAILFNPLQRRWAPRFGDRNNLLSLVVLLLATLIVILPLLAVVTTLAQEVAAFYGKVQTGEIDVAGYIEHSGQIPPTVQRVLHRIGIDLSGPKQLLKDVSLQSSHFLATQALSLGQNTAQFLVAVALMVYLTFFFLRDGNALVRVLIRALPLGDEREHRLFHKISEVVGAVIKGNLVVASVQGTLGGLIFWMLDIQAPLFWGVMMVFVSLLPAVGAPLIWGPVAIYFLATGSIWQGVTLAAFGAGVIGLVDNLLRPILVGRNTKMPDYVVLISTLGGISIFGLNGFVLGPLIAALFICFWDIFIREFNPG